MFRNLFLTKRVALNLGMTIKDPDFIQEVCYSPIGKSLIKELSRTRFRNSHKMREFLITTFLLGETLCVVGLPPALKAICLEQVNWRRGIITQHIRNGELPILDPDDVQALDNLVDVGMQLYHSENRQNAMAHMESMMLASMAKDRE